MSKSLKRWAKLALGLSVPGLGLSYYAYWKYQQRHEATIPMVDTIPPLNVTLKPLPQYGKNFKVARVREMSLGVGFIPLHVFLHLYSLAMMVN